LAEIRSWDVAAVLIVALAIWGYVDVRNRGRIVPGNLEAHRTDFTVFTEAGRAFFDGRDPYRVTNPRGWKYLYPPLFALLVSPLAALDSESQVVVWYIVSVALGFGCYRESRLLWRFLAAHDAEARGELVPLRDPASWVGLCAGLAVLLPALDCLQRGQLGIALVYPLLFGFRLALAGGSWPRWLFGGVVLSLPIVVKLIPALPVAFLLFQGWVAALSPGRSPRSGVRAAALSLGVATGGFLFVFAIPASCVGWNQNLHHLETWYRKVAASVDVGREANFHFDSIRNQSLANGAHLLVARVRGNGEKPAPQHWFAADRATAERRRADTVTQRGVKIARGIVLGLLAAAGLATGLRGDLASHAAAYGLSCTAILLVSPLSWGHYYVLALPAVLCVPLWMARSGHPIAARAFAAGPAILTWVHYLAMRKVGPIGLLGLGTTAWFLAVGILLVLIRPRPAAAETRLVSLPHADQGHALADPSRRRSLGFASRPERVAGHGEHDRG
jgi:hypothetical protein